MRIAVAQLGARRHYAVPRILHEAGMLERLFTDSYIGNKPWLRRLVAGLPAGLRPTALARLLGRDAGTLPTWMVTSFDGLGMVYSRKTAGCRDATGLRATYAAAGRAFGKKVVGAGFGDADTFWGFESSSLEAFRAAKTQNLRCILEQTIAPQPVQTRLLRAELKRWPGWQPGLSIASGTTELERRERAEWDLADLIVCGSQFVVDGIAECGGPVEKCRVVPYGVELDGFPLSQPRRRSQEDRLRVLFAGEVGLRKGAPWLLEAARMLGTNLIELRLAGTISLAREKIAPFAEVATFLGAVPRAEMARHFAWADVFVLPSNCEGSATVTYEAVASGVPVICTPNTGALASEAVSMVDQGEVDQLARTIQAYWSASNEIGVSTACRLEYGLQAYSKRLLAAVRQ